jgi:hypothetical protein
MAASSSFDTIIDSIRDRLLTLPGDAEVRTGHGDSTSIGAEIPQSGVPAQERRSGFRH